MTRAQGRTHGLGLVPGIGVLLYLILAPTPWVLLGQVDTTYVKIAHRTHH
jgi:hypothetical protein